MPQIQIEDATRDKLEPHIGKVITHHEKYKETGKLLVISDSHYGIETDRDHMGGAATIESQLEYIKNPNYTCDKSTVILWGAIRGEFTVHDGEGSPEPKGTDNYQSMDNHQSAAWGVKAYDPPPGAPFEFL